MTQISTITRDEIEVVPNIPSVVEAGRRVGRNDPLLPASGIAAANRG